MRLHSLARVLRGTCRRWAAMSAIVVTVPGVLVLNACQSVDAPLSSASPSSGSTIESSAAATGSAPPQTSSSLPAGTSSAAAPTTTRPKAPPPPVPRPPGPPAESDFTLPIRAAFYYPWYPDVWNENAPASGTNFHPSAGLYDESSRAVVDRQVDDLKYAGLQAGIASWWGQGSREDRRMPLLLAAAQSAGFAWAPYYEREGFGNPTSVQLKSDLSYILTKYGSSPAYLHINGRPAIFVYGDGDDGCAMSERWAEANTLGFFVVLKVFGGYAACAHQPQGWHQYAPGGSLDMQHGYSAVVSPGFWRNAEAVHLPRDITRFRADATTVAMSGAPLQLVTTFNEWPEGTAVESATEWASSDGHGQYVDVLHEVFAAHPR